MDTHAETAQNRLLKTLERLLEIVPCDLDSALGLYLARGITEAHGGSLEVDSRPGDGARFMVRLPLERASHV